MNAESILHSPVPGKEWTGATAPVFGQRCGAIFVSWTSQAAAFKLKVNRLQNIDMLK